MFCPYILREHFSLNLLWLSWSVCRKKADQVLCSKTMQATRNVSGFCNSIGLELDVAFFNWLLKLLLLSIKRRSCIRFFGKCFVAKKWPWWWWWCGRPANRVVGSNRATTSGTKEMYKRQQYRRSKAFTTLKLILILWAIPRSQQLHDKRLAKFV